MITDWIPEILKTQIADYLKSRCSGSMANVWRRNKSDEDGFTASFFEKIAKNPDTTLVHGHLWEWSIDYSTTSSRGQKPLETVIGADVIFFIEIKLPNKKVYRKGIVIQSKITSKMNSRS